MVCRDERDRMKQSKGIPDPWRPATWSGLVDLESMCSKSALNTGLG